MAKQITIFLSALILAVVALAVPASAEFHVSYELIEDTIYPDEIAEFRVIIQNLDSFDDSFTVYTIDPSWILETSPKGINVGKQSSGSFSLFVQPKSGLPTGPYLIPIRFKSVNNPQMNELMFFIYLKSYSPPIGEFQPVVDLVVGFPEKIDPRQKLSLEVFLRNRNALEINSLNVIVNSELFFKEYTTHLGPVEQKTNELLFDINPLVHPGIYDVTTQISINNKTLSEVKKKIIVIDYSKIEEEYEKVNELFKTTEYITVKNIGNEKKTGIVHRQKNFFARIFTKTDPSVKPIEISGKKTYQWSVQLDPQKEYEIIIVENYRGLASIIIAILLIIVGYYLFRSPIVSLKKAKLFGLKEDNASFIKIKLFLKNRTKKPVYHIKVIDKVPRMAKVVEDYDILGTLKPTKVIRHERAGSIVRWDIEKLDPYEERIITYKIRSHLKILGSIKLAAAKIKFDTGLGKERSTYSNSVKIDTELVMKANDYSDDIKKIRGQR